MQPAPETLPLLRVGETCWGLERATRLAVIVDAAEYFAVVKAALLEARHSILLIAWDFDTRVQLEFDECRPGVPNHLGRLLYWMTQQRPELTIRVLKWNLDVLKDLAREPFSLIWFDWLAGSQLKVRLDWQHPPGACHHQKIIVIDDALAFCGGIDMTVDRWDTRKHLDHDPRRTLPRGRSYGPWHDAAIAVDGPAARALGDLARERWHRATGERLDPPPGTNDPWPVRLSPTINDVLVGIARTEPRFHGHPAITEIESLYLAAIRSARNTIYLESQYFASRRIAEALADRMAEENPPEVIVVNPVRAIGWLEEEAMGTSRALLLARIRKADHRGKFRIYTPSTEGGAPIYVHAKIMVVDERFLRVGSSNLNNRSMGFDTECDLAIEARDDDPEQALRRDEITAFLHDLLAEHLGVTAEAVSCARDAHGGSLIAALEGLLRPTGRTLRPFEPPKFDRIEEYLSEHELLDPEPPENTSVRTTSFVYSVFYRLGLTRSRRNSAAGAMKRGTRAGGNARPTR